MVRPNPRSACIEALRNWEQGKLFADEVLHRLLASRSFSALDRAFLTELFYGVLRNLSLLDFIIGLLREGKIDAETRRILRLGLYQLLLMRVPSHAAVNETVSLAGRSRGVVNAILRRATREHPEIIAKIQSAAPAVRFSHPAFLINRWRQQFNDAEALELCGWNNLPAEIYVRANTLRVTPGELLRASEDAEPMDAHPLSLRMKKLPLGWILKGLCYVQDPSTLTACDLLDAQPGERILDACAAPGGKTSYIAQQMANRGSLVATDSAAGRLKPLIENLQRLGVTNATVFEHDWTTASGTLEPESFDRILVDAPCSNTGVIRRRIDVRWRLTPDDFLRMQQKQLAILKNLAPLLRKGGTLVYSTCSLEPEENEQLVELVSKEIPELKFQLHTQKLPFRDKVDGAYAAKFTR